MTRLEKELDHIFTSLMFPTRFAKTFANSGTSYPPYNIVRIDSNLTVLEVAVAGFKESELSVSVDDMTLKISGKKIDESKVDYIYKGIGTRAFERAFTLSSDIKITKAEYKDGILSVFIEYLVPETKTPNVIQISKVE